MIFTSPLDAPRFTKDIKNEPKIDPKSSQIGARRPPKHAPEMHAKKWWQKCCKSGAKRGPRDPLLEAQNQKSREVRAAIWRPDGVPSLLGAKSGPKIATGPQNCQKSSKDKSKIVAEIIKIRPNPSKSSQNFLFPQGQVKIAESKGRRWCAVGVLNNEEEKASKHIKALWQSEPWVPQKMLLHRRR